MISTSSAQVLETFDRWWKCLNRFEEIGCVPSNILEPLSALDAVDSSVVYRQVPTCMATLYVLGLLTHAATFLFQTEDVQPRPCEVFLLHSVQPCWDQPSSYLPGETSEHGPVIHAAGRRWRSR